MPQPSAMTSFDFMGRRRLALIISAVLILGSLVAVALRGLNLGIDFTGGVMSPVIDDNTGMLTSADRRAIAVYLKSLPGDE